MKRPARGIGPGASKGCWHGEPSRHPVGRRGAVGEVRGGKGSGSLFHFGWCGPHDGACCQRAGERAARTASVGQAIKPRGGLGLELAGPASHGVRLAAQVRPQASQRLGSSRTRSSGGNDGAPSALPLWLFSFGGHLRPASGQPKPGSFRWWPERSLPWSSRMMRVRLASKDRPCSCSHKQRGATARLPCSQCLAALQGQMKGENR